MVRALLGLRSVAMAGHGTADQAKEVVVVEFTVDDATPQLLAYAGERLFEAGALDVHTVPVHMKMGRAGHHVVVLARPDAFDAITRTALTETTTLGLRFRREGRVELDRAVERIATPYGPVRLKVGRLDGAEVHAEPEYDDCAVAARRHRVPLLTVQRAALAARRRSRATVVKKKR